MTSVAKLSMHSNGKWQFRVATMAKTWTKPKEFRRGWTYGPIVLIPHNDLANRLPYMAIKSSEKIHWLPQPRSGFVAQVQLLFNNPQFAVDGWQPEDVGYVSLATLPLRNGMSIRVVRHDREILPEEAKTVVESRRVLLEASSRSEKPLGYSGFTVTSHQLGGPLIFEVQHDMTLR